MTIGGLMEVFFNKNISALSGKNRAKTKVFMHYKLKNNCYVRTWVYPAEKNQQIAIATNGPFLSLLWWSSSDLYKNDLREYAEEFRHQSPNNTASSYSLFVKIIWAISEKTNISIPEMTMDFLFDFSNNLKDQINELNLFKTINYHLYINPIIEQE